MMASLHSRRLECITCDAPITLESLSAAARSAGSGFCDLCKDIDAEMAGPLNRTYPLRDVPVLGDIDGDVSEILKNSVDQSNETIALALAQNIPPPTLKETRYDLLCKAVANINEGQALKNQTLTSFKPSRRCANVDKCALDIVELFKFVSCLSDEIPTCLKSKQIKIRRQELPPPPSQPPPPPYHSVMKQSSRVSRFISDKINSLVSNMTRPLPPDISLSQPQMNSISSLTSPPPPPPAPPLPPQFPPTLSSSTELLLEETHDTDESINLFLNATPGVGSVSLGEDTLGLYPNTTVRTPASVSARVPFKTPAELRCRSGFPATSSPMNRHAPSFFPSQFESSSLPAQNSSSLPTSIPSTHESIHDLDKHDLQIKIEDLQSEMRMLNCELKTYKGFVDEMRLQSQTPPHYPSNWPEAKECMDRINSILAPLTDSQQRSIDAPRQLSTDSAQNDSSPLTPSSVTQERNLNDLLHQRQNIPQAMILLQRELEWIISHMIDQDKKLLDLKMENENIREDMRVLASKQPPSVNRPPTTTSHVTPHPVIATDIPPPPQFADDCDIITPPPPPSDDHVTVSNVPVSNRFECLTAEDADIYDVPGSTTTAQAEPYNSSAASTRPVPRPRPRRSRTAQNKKRPKVSNVGSSMIREQEVHQQARGLDSKCQAFSGRCAHEIQPHVMTATAEDDDAIVLGGGTNNIPRDYVADAIIDIARLIDHTRKIRPNQQIIIPQMLNRYDSDDYEQHNEKIRRINIFLKHRCTKDSRMHFLPLDIINREDLYDGLHLDYIGKDKFAAAVSDLVLSLVSNE